jgi:hypothetical protein
MSSVPVKKLAIGVGGNAPPSLRPKRRVITFLLHPVTPLFSAMYKHYTHNNQNNQALRKEYLQ